MADLQSVHGFRCCDNIARTRNVIECLYSLYAWVVYFFGLEADTMTRTLKTETKILVLRPIWSCMYLYLYVCMYVCLYLCVSLPMYVRVYVCLQGESENIMLLEFC